MISEGKRYYVWNLEPYYGDRWVAVKRNGHTRFVRDFGVIRYKVYCTADTMYRVLSDPLRSWFWRRKCKETIRKM